MRRRLSIGKAYPLSKTWNIEWELGGLRDQADQLAESQGKELKDSVEELKESKESAGHADEEEQAKGALPEGQE